MSNNKEKDFGEAAFVIYLPLAKVAYMDNNLSIVTYSIPRKHNHRH